MNIRQAYHQALCQEVMFLDRHGIPNNADKHREESIFFARGIARILDFRLRTADIPIQTIGKRFERITARYLENVFRSLSRIRPGKWLFSTGEGIGEFEGFEPFVTLERALATDKELEATLGDYIIKPDIVIGRMPVSDREINNPKKLISDSVAIHTPLRKSNSSKAILHASISCKWTIRSDRSQNARTEALNLIRNRKGNTPHIVIVTAEPYPQRIASLALGTGDIDCVYHIALPELQQAAVDYKNEAVLEMLDILVGGKRLRDVSDLPFDLAV